MRVERVGKMPELGVQNVSVERALRWLQQFALREWQLLLPVALAFISLPTLVTTLALVRQARTDAPTLTDLQALGTTMPGWEAAALAAGMVVPLLGALTLMALALGSRVSVGEAILQAVRRLPTMLGVIALLLVGVMVALIVILAAARVAGGGGRYDMPFEILGMLASGFAIVLLLPVAMTRRGGPIGIIRDGIGLYAGSMLRISAGLILFIVGAWIVLMAIKISVGSLILLLARAAGQREIGDVLRLIVDSVMAGIAWSGFYLLVASFYRQRVGVE